MVISVPFHQYAHEISGATAAAVLLDILRKETPVEVVANGVVNESLLGLGLRSCLTFEDHIIVPPAAHMGFDMASWVQNTNIPNVAFFSICLSQDI